MVVEEEEAVTRSRQQRWQDRQTAAGRCKTCGKLRGQYYACYCDECGLKQSKRNRERVGTKRVLPGSDLIPVRAARERLQAQAAGLYQGNFSLEATAHVLGVCPATVRVWLVRLGVERRPQGRRCSKAGKKP